MPFAILLISLLTGFGALNAAPKDRFIRNQHENRDLSLCVNTNGTNTCPIVIVGSTGLASVSLGALTDSLTLTGTPTVLFRMQETLVSSTTLDFLVSSTKISTPALGSATIGTNAGGDLAFNSNNRRRILIDSEGSISIRQSSSADAVDFGGAPLMVTGASTWVPVLDTGFSSSSKATLVLGPSTGSTAGSSAILFDTGSVSESWRMKANTTSGKTFEIAHATATDTYVSDLEIQGEGANVGQVSLKVRDDGDGTGCQGMTGNTLCSGEYTAVVSGGCGSSPANPTGYFRIGDRVHVYGMLTNSGGSCGAVDSFQFSLPITVGNFSSDNEVGGTFVCEVVGSTGLAHGVIEQTNSDNKVTFQFDGNTSCQNNDKIRYSFTYKIP